MGSIRVDESRFVARHHCQPDMHELGLWTFSIQEEDICFWGRYPEAVSTAKLYANCHGLDAGTITLLDCTGSLRGATKH